MYRERTLADDLHHMPLFYLYASEPRVFPNKSSGQHGNDLQLGELSGNTDVDLSIRVICVRTKFTASSFILQIHAGYKKAAGEAQYLFLIQADIHAAGAVEKQLFRAIAA